MAEEAQTSQEEMDSLREEKETPETEEETETPEETTEETKTPETSQEEKPEGKSKELQSALAQKDHWRKKAEEFKNKLKFQKPETKEGQDEWKSKVEFLLQNQSKSYSEKEFDHIAIVSTQENISLEEAATNEDEYIQFKREKVLKEKGTPSPSSPGSPLSDKTPEQLEELAKDDKKWTEYEAEQLKNLRAKRRGI